MPDIFLSYNREDQATARRFAEAFQAEGFEVWWDTTLRAGEAYDEVTEQALNEARAVVVLWSPRSVVSRWVRAEATQADRNKTLVPVTIEACRRPIMFELTQTADLSDWDGSPADRTWQAFLADLKRLVQGDGPAPTPAPPIQSAPQTPTRTERQSICVLPFANISDDPQQEYFSDGISEDIITDLSKVSALSVIARNSAFAFKKKNVDIAEVARQLKVTHVLEGSVRKAGNRVRITAQLINGATNDHLWAERWDRDLDDIFALQDEISEAIVSALKIKLLPQEKKSIERRGTDSVEAYDLYLMARQELLAGATGARPYEALIRLCRRAVEIDPDYAQPWALVAIALTVRRATYGEAGVGGRAEAERALELNDQLAEAHAAMARVLMLEGRDEEAVAETQLAMRLDPDSREVNQVAAYMYFRQQRFDYAARYWERNLELFDEDTSSPSMLITCYQTLGRRQDLERVAKIQLGRVEKALVRDRNDSRMLGHGCLALSALGETDRAREWMNRALLIDPDNVNMRYNFACALAGMLNSADAALDVLEPVFRTGGGGLLAHAMVDPDLDCIREHPRFTSMIAEAEARLAAVKAGETAASG